MQPLSNKHILVVGEETPKIAELEKQLKDRSFRISRTHCDKVVPDYIADNKIDLIILNHLGGGEVFSQMIGVLSGNKGTSCVPVFTLVSEDAVTIERVLLDGAADYITENEDAASVMRKVEAVFSEDDVFSDNSVIDITPSEVIVSSKGVRVYVVEDDPLLRNLLSLRLDKSSFPYEFSLDGKDVLPSMHQFKPDVIILDLMLPGRSGFDVLKDVKADEDLNQVPVVVFSNRDGADDRKKAKELGAVSFYVKAMTDLSELMETIQSLVKNR